MWLWTSVWEQYLDGTILIIAQIEKQLLSLSKGRAENVAKV